MLQEATTSTWLAFLCVCVCVCVPTIIRYNDLLFPYYFTFKRKSVSSGVVLLFAYTLYTSTNY
jgi:hypothetical protein